VHIVGHFLIHLIMHGMNINKNKFLVYMTAYTNLLLNETQNIKFRDSDITGL
jgi:hypothetical protein